MNAEPDRVLVVNDDPSVCRCLQAELAACGLACRTASNTVEAIRLVGEFPFRAVVTDITMPEVNGLELLAYTRRTRPDCRVILVTGSSRREYLAQAIMLGAYDYLDQPVDPAELAALVSRAVGEEDHPPPLPQRAAAAIEAARHVKMAALESVRALVRAVEAKDHYTRRHSEQVAFYAVSLAEGQGLPEATVECIRTAALLHDVGKIGVPDRVLTKAGPLNDREFAFIRRHPELGADILANITVFGREAELVRHHHENWDGTGYPHGLAGEETPLGARVIQAADCLDAMLMERTYKPSLPLPAVMGEFRRCAGSQFDPRLAAAAIDWCRAHPELLFLPGSDRAAASAS